MTDRNSDPQNRIQAAINAADIVEEVQSANGCTTPHVMDRLGIPRSTAYIYLKTLEELGFLKKHDDEYHLGIKFLKYGGQARHNIDVYQIARREVDQLAEETEAVATVGCEDDGQRVLLYRTESGGAVSDNPPMGEYTRMHWTALGKALLSKKSDAEIEKIVERYGLPRATDNTLTDLDELLDTIDEIRSRGYAIEDEERSTGVKSIAMAIEFGDDLFDTIAISIAGPTSKFTADMIENELSQRLREAVNVIELRKEHY